MKPAFSHDIGRFTAALWLASVIVFLSSSVAQADRIYHLVDRPLEQFGRTLTGTITTTDDAPLDSMLELEEIIDWQFSVTGSFDHSFSRSDGEMDFTSTAGVGISATEIFLLPTLGDGGIIHELKLGVLKSTGRGPDGAFVTWSLGLDTNGDSSRYTSTRAATDVIVPYWTTLNAAPTDTSWLIAVVPEPNTAVLAVLSITMCALGRHRRIRG